MAAVEPKRTPARTQSATTQTIEQIEARLVEVREADRDAMQRIADLLRELAVTLPIESKLPLRFAKAAKSIDAYTGGGILDPAGADWYVETVVREHGEDEEDAALRGILRACERMPASSTRARSVGMFADALRSIVGE